MQPVIHCKYDKLIKASELIKFAHPLNSNNHSQDQIDALKKILEYQGFRYAVKRSNLSKWITTGHGRTLAGLKEDWDIPVVWQDYKDEVQEFADVTADNTIASRAELDLEKMRADALKLNLDTNGFDIELLGLPDLILDEPAVIDLDDKPDKDNDQLKHILEVEFTDEQDMMAVYKDLLSRGYIAKVK